MLFMFYVFCISTQIWITAKGGTPLDQKKRLQEVDFHSDKDQQVVVIVIIIHTTHTIFFHLDAKT